jgi:hypothetical protein
LDSETCEYGPGIKADCIRFYMCGLVSLHGRVARINKTTKAKVLYQMAFAYNECEGLWNISIPVEHKPSVFLKKRPFCKKDP